MLVDAQIHLWAADSPDRPWPPDARHTAHRATPPEVEETLAVLDAAGVGRAVLVPPSWEGDRNDVALSAAARHPDRFAVMGRIPFHEPTVTRDLPKWRQQPGMLGVRLTLHREPWQSMFRAGGFPWFWSAAEKAALPVMVYPPGGLDPLAIVARRHPDLRLIVDHLALPVGAIGADAWGDLDDLLALSKFPNVAVKATALPCNSGEAFPFTDLHEPMRRVFDAFGPARMFWGSDWTRLPCPYQDNVRFFTDALDFLSGDDLRQVMGQSLLEWVGWPATAPAHP
ncbi:amidohydrolase family protein [Amycolatopsis sp. NPDC049868]|uniref:amidohydrolase family protein n=1 Tax=Amycolatopsis sp. NPDC049868 TaxID=3363934 RepID=UPI00379F7DE1